MSTHINLSLPITTQCNLSEKQINRLVQALITDLSASAKTTTRVINADATNGQNGAFLAPNLAGTSVIQALRAPRNTLITPAKPRALDVRLDMVASFRGTIDGTVPRDLLRPFVRAACLRLDNLRATMPPSLEEKPHNLIRVLLLLQEQLQRA